MKVLSDRKLRARAMARELKKLFSHKAGTALNYSNPWELLVAVVLSAQSRDVRVNEITDTLFKKYKKIKEYANASLEEFDNDIARINYHHTKAKNITNAAKIVMSEFGGNVPETMEELMSLPGVGRKSANVILSNAFKDSQGIAVDTHVRRFAIRFDLTDHTDPSKIEQDLMKLLPKSEWFDFHNNLIFYGREICTARPHDCSSHPLTKLYPEAARRWPKAR
jgi:endonuclease III